MGSQVRALLFPPNMALWCSRLARQPVTLEVDGSSPFGVAIIASEWSVSSARYASVAQSVEQWTENPRVVGSIPTGGTMVPLWEPRCGCSSSGRAPPCQGGGSEFEPRHPLQENQERVAFLISIWYCSQVVRPRSAKPLFASSNLASTSKIDVHFRCNL